MERAQAGTDMQNADNHALAVLFVTVLGVGLILSFIAMIGFSDFGASRGDGGGTTADELSWLIDGTVTQAAEDQLESRFPARTLAVRTSAALRYLAFRSGNAGVVVGRDGWLFTREEMEHHEGDGQVLESRLEYILATRSALGDAGVELLVVLVPSKARVLSDMLSPRWSRLADHARYGEALNRLETHEVPVVDLLPHLNKVDEPFLKRDTHWSPQGVRAAAEAISRKVSNSLASRISSSDIGAYEYRTTRGSRLTVAGDLMSFVPLGPWASSFGLARQSVFTTETIQLEAPALGLFDLPTIPVTLVGTSFSADERWNFEGELRSSLGSDVLNISAEAVGPFVPMEEYLQGSAFREVKPGLVIWEVPERYLTLPDVELPGSMSAVE